MANQQILEKAISKAIDGGWENETWLSVTVHHNYEVGSTVSKSYSTYEWRDYAPIIFQKDFAKALWGDTSYAELKGATYSSANITREPKAWQYHLQQMVIAEDPIQYLGEHLDG